MKIINVKQGSQEWSEFRLGKITGTRIKKALSSTNLDLVDELIAEMVSGKSEDNYESEDMVRGTEYEPLAVEAYEKEFGVKVDRIGLIQHDKYDWLCMSPDGLFNGNTKGIEIKCPKTKTHTKYIRMGKVPAEYWHQVLSMFLINENLKSHDFISYDPRFTLKPLFVVTTNREEVKTALEVLESDLVLFWNKVLKYHDQIVF